MTNMLSKPIGDLVVGVHNTQLPTRTEWGGWMDHCRQVDPQTIRIVGFTDGGAPSVKQRSEWNNYLGGAQPRIAIVTNGMFARGVVTAMSWFNSRIRAFAPDDYQDAFLHVGISDINAAH